MSIRFNDKMKQRILPIVLFLILQVAFIRKMSNLVLPPYVIFTSFF